MKYRGMFHSKWRWHRVTVIMARDGGACHLCGEPLDRRVKDTRSAKYISFDHVTPRSLGGLDVVSNIRLAHRLCNSLRGCDPIAPEDERNT